MRYLVVAYMDSEDMTGERLDISNPELVAGHVWGFLRRGFKTVLVEEAGNHARTRGDD